MRVWWRLEGCVELMSACLAGDEAHPAMTASGEVMRHPEVESCLRSCLLRQLSFRTPILTVEMRGKVGVVYDCV